MNDGKKKEKKKKKKKKNCLVTVLGRVLMSIFAYFVLTARVVSDSGQCSERVALWRARRDHGGICASHVSAQVSIVLLLLPRIR